MRSRRRRRKNIRQHETEIPGEQRVTAELRMKRRAVTTQEAAVEDDRSTGLQIGSVGVRGHLMNTHSKEACEQQRFLPLPFFQEESTGSRVLCFLEERSRDGQAGRLPLKRHRAGQELVTAAV